MIEQDPAPEQSWTFRRIFTWTATAINSGLLAAIIWKLDDPTALKWLGLALVVSNIVMATFYLVAPSAVELVSGVKAWRKPE